MNEHLKELMPGLTAKVFRTYNASITLQRQLDELTDGDASVPEKILAYNRANRAVAVLCNHQRAVPKGMSFLLIIKPLFVVLSSNLFLNKENHNLSRRHFVFLYHVMFFPYFLFRVV